MIITLLVKIDRDFSRGNLVHSCFGLDDKHLLQALKVVYY